MNASTLSLSLALALSAVCLFAAGCGGSGTPRAAPPPQNYKALVVGKAQETFGADKLMRNMIVHPPVSASMKAQGGTLYGHAGRADLSVIRKNQGASRESWCYFIHNGVVTAFTPADTAMWCPPPR